MKLTLIKTQLIQVYTAKYTGVYPYLKVDGKRTFKYARTSGLTSFARIFGFAPLKTFGKLEIVIENRVPSLASKNDYSTLPLS